MEIIDIINYIVQYGVYPILMAVLLYLLIKQGKHNADSNQTRDQRGDNIIDRLDKIEEMVKRGPTHTLEDEERTRQLNDYVDAQLSSLLDCTLANRAYVFSYHNGGRDIMGRGYQKMSVMNEIVDISTPPIMPKYQNVPRTMFPTLFKKLKEDDYYNIEDIAKIKEADPMSYQLFVDHGAHSVFIQAIKREDGLVVGFVVIEYVTNTCVDFSKAKKGLEKKTLRITGALMASEEQEG